MRKRVVAIAAGVAIALGCTACSTDKQNIQEIESGIAKILAKSSGITNLKKESADVKTRMTKFSHCIASKTSGKISKAGYASLASGKDIYDKASADYKLLLTATQECLTSLTKDDEKK